MNTQVFKVNGMGCDHCVRAVTDELAGLPDVQTVDVDLAAGTATVAARELGESEVAAAVEEAGYELVRDKSNQHT